MIPKIVHFCWLSGAPFPSKIKKCIDSWKKYLPDYEIMLWNSNKFDVNSVPWVKEAFERKKYAFCADYIRFYALYHYGGFYLDSDVQVVRSYNNLLHLPFVMGYETSLCFEASTIGSIPAHPVAKAMLDYYSDKHFIQPDGSIDTLPLPFVMQKVFDNKFPINNISSVEQYDKSDVSIVNIFPSDWFSPLETQNKMILKQTENTYSIHHFANSWVGFPVRMIYMIFGKTSYASVLLCHFVYKSRAILRKLLVSIHIIS